MSDEPKVLYRLKDRRRNDHIVICAMDGDYLCSVEDLYQAFKARLIEEVVSSEHLCTRGAESIYKEIPLRDTTKGADDE